MDGEDIAAAHIVAAAFMVVDGVNTSLARVLCATW